MRAWRIPVAVTALGLLGACSPDYSAVRDWSTQARETLLPAPSVGAPATVPAPAAATALPPPPPIAETGRAGAVRAMQEAAASWLAFLAYLADDGLPLAREDPLAALPPHVEPVDAEGAAAIRNLGQTMAFAARRLWRAPQLAYAVAQGDPYFQPLMTALARQSDALAGEGPDERASFEARFAPVLAGAQAPGSQAALQELRAVRLAELSRRAEAAAARRAAITRIAEGHALLAERKRILSQSETARLMRAQESELRRLSAITTGG
jgi:hypothetical protein